jgi:hypothetical protein
MSALVLKAQMECLMLRHDQELVPPVALPLVDPGDRPLIFEGYASTAGVDAERCCSTRLG